MQPTLWSYTSFKDSGLNLKATHYKLNYYHHAQLMLGRYLLEYIFGCLQMRNYLRKTCPEQKVYNWQASQRQTINHFSSIFVFFCLSSHFLSLFTSLIKTKSAQNQRQRITWLNAMHQTTRIPTPLSDFFLWKPRHGSLENSFTRNLASPLFSKLSNTRVGWTATQIPITRQNRGNTTTNSHQFKHTLFSCLGESQVWYCQSQAGKTGPIGHDQFRAVPHFA